MHGAGAEKRTIRFQGRVRLRTGRRFHVRVKREVLPIIFVPGIMGSRLRNRSSGESVWNPDSGGFISDFYRRGAAARKRHIVGERFDPDFLEADREGDEEHNQHFADYEHAVRCGWPSIFWGSYGGFVRTLQQHRWLTPIPQSLFLPIHTFGYNWSQSNRRSGEQLAKYVDETIQLYRDKGRPCDRVILVTHSMGGLVARSACIIHGAIPKVLAVLHGAQPSTGAPICYWRMKGGTDAPSLPFNVTELASDLLHLSVARDLEDATAWLQGLVGSWVLGSSGELSTTLIANLPGPLELLPNQYYRDNAGHRAWLHLPTEDGGVRSLPDHDPYDEIYLQRDVYYRLVEPAWLDPGGQDPEGAWEACRTHLKNARTFHHELVEDPRYATNRALYLQRARQFYADGVPTADTVRFARDPDASARTPAAFLEQLGTEAKKMLTLFMGGENGFETQVTKGDLVDPRGKHRIVLEPPSGTGDGTVPASSGRALDLPETVAIGEADERWNHRSHEPIFRCQTAHSWVFRQLSAILRSHLQSAEAAM